MNQVVCRLRQLLAAGGKFQVTKINFVKIVTALLRIQKKFHKQNTGGGGV
jgi:hypothetical protein